MIRRDSHPVHSPRARAEESTHGNERTSPVSGVSVLDAWTRYDWSHGVDLASMPDGAVIEVVTLRSVYYIMATRGEVRPLSVRGGCYLPAFRHAASIGSTMGGAMLKQNMVHVGFRMELAFDDLRLITSQVTAVRPLPEMTDRRAP